MAQIQTVPASEFSTVVAKMQAEQKLRADAILNTRDHVELEIVQTVGGEPDVHARFHTPDLETLNGISASITPFAHRQIAERNNIPFPYYQRMLADQPELLLRNVHTWWRSEPEMRMARTIRPVDLADGQATIGPTTLRGWLSDRFRVLDNLPFCVTVLQQAEEAGATIQAAHLDEERFYLKLVSPRLEAKIDRGRHDPVDDVLQAGIIVRNSEVGDGRVSVRPYVYRLVCTNGMIAMKEYAQVHLGSRNQLGLLSAEAIEADARAVWLQVRDYVKHAFNPDTLKETVEMFERADKVRIQAKATDAVANVVQHFDLAASEAQGILERYLRGNEDTMFGLVNAVTQYAHEGPDFRRQVELEEIGGRLLATAPTDFTALVNRTVGDRELAKMFAGAARN